MGHLSAGVRQLPYSDNIVAHGYNDVNGTHDIVSWVPPAPYLRAVSRVSAPVTLLSISQNWTNRIFAK